MAAGECARGPQRKKYVVFKVAAGVERSYGRLGAWRRRICSCVQASVRERLKELSWSH